MWSDGTSRNHTTAVERPPGGAERDAACGAPQKADVIPGGDMTTEAISCKLAYLFGRGDLSVARIKEFLQVGREVGRRSAVLLASPQARLRARR